MRVLSDGNSYRMWLSPRNTTAWANKSGAAWPCSTIAGHSLYVEVDSTGLCDLAIDGRADLAIDGHELAAIVADHLPAHLRCLWPRWD